MQTPQRGAGLSKNPNAALCIVHTICNAWCMDMCVVAKPRARNGVNVQLQSAPSDCIGAGASYHLRLRDGHDSMMPRAAPGTSASIKHKHGVLFALHTCCRGIMVSLKQRGDEIPRNLKAEAMPGPSLGVARGWVQCISRTPGTCRFGIMAATVKMCV